MTNGYIFLYRALTEHPLWTQLPEAWLKVWIGILLRANFKPGRWDDGHKEYDLPAGAFATSIERFADFAHVSVSQVRSAFSYLEGRKMITRTVARKATIVSVLNWESYQPMADAPSQDESTGDSDEIARSSHDHRTIIATEEEYKNNNTLSPSDAVDRNSTRRVSSKTVSEADASFENEFWPLYPRKVGKAAALRHYRAKGRTAGDRIEIMAGLKRQLPELRSRDPKYIPHAATWLSQGRWEDQTEIAREQEQPVFRLMM